MTIRLAISVEGPTEQEFCREVLCPHFLDRDMVMVPVVVTTKRIIDGPNFKGGSISIDRIQNEVRPLLRSFHYVSTLYDYYGFVDREDNETPDQLCLRIAAALGNPPTLIPYVQVHEFESLIFSGPDAVGQCMQSAALGKELYQAVQTCGSPEQVNDSPATAPSKRLTNSFSLHLKSKYDKKFHGPLLTLEIGLAVIRAGCPRFDNWLSRLETLPTR